MLFSCWQNNNQRSWKQEEFHVSRQKLLTILIFLNSSNTFQCGQRFYILEEVFFRNGSHRWKLLSKNDSDRLLMIIWTSNQEWLSYCTDPYYPHFCQQAPTLLVNMNPSYRCLRPDIEIVLETWSIQKFESKMYFLSHYCFPW